MNTLKQVICERIALINPISQTKIISAFKHKRLDCFCVTIIAVVLRISLFAEVVFLGDGAKMHSTVNGVEWTYYYKRYKEFHDDGSGYGWTESWTECVITDACRPDYSFLKCIL